MQISNSRFLGIEDRVHFFTDAERAMIAWQILNHTSWDKKDDTCIGIQRLLDKGVYEAAYPLHDGPYDQPNRDGSNSDRRVSYFFIYPANYG